MNTALRFAILEVLTTYGRAASTLETITPRVRKSQPAATAEAIAGELPDLCARGYVTNLQVNDVLPGVWEITPAGRDQVNMVVKLDGTIHGNLALGGPQ